MRVLEEYGILTGCDVTKYLMHTLALVRQEQGKRHSPPSQLKFARRDESQTR